MSVVQEDVCAIGLLQRYLKVNPRWIGHIDGIVDDTQPLFYIVVGIDGQVFNVYLRPCIEIHLAGDAGEAPEVLVFEVGAVAPAHHLHGDEVLALLQVFSNVELGSHLRILAVAHVFAIDPHLEVAGGRAHVEVDLLTVPVGGQVERAAVGTGVVVGLADVGWVVVESGTPGVAGVLVDFVAVALNLEKTGHGEVHPLRVIELQREEVRWGEVMVFHKVEAPLALHREIAVGLLLVAGLRLVNILEGEEVGTAHLAVHLINTGIFPFWLYRCRNIDCQQYSKHC